MRAILAAAWLFAGGMGRSKCMLFPFLFEVVSTFVFDHDDPFGVFLHPSPVFIPYIQILHLQERNIIHRSRFGCFSSSFISPLCAAAAEMM
ncbi:hypothetical protein M440DRAFT_1146377 [Trichoderma longibrachiatum ATCC 18648]|uniref:Secreted protein n=1 Tax=Trichoderma longibrachiatum ATCC 18648 TaxID=983965 RepID=A0A2T4BQC5_TRILO|nr:hypothetical protein M440DRAFT_1146377 [Trichoderma longibrachiatum ATCC 18648]